MNDGFNRENPDDFENKDSESSLQDQNGGSGGAQQPEGNGQPYQNPYSYQQPNFPPYSQGSGFSGGYSSFGNPYAKEKPVQSGSTEYQWNFESYDNAVKQKGKGPKGNRGLRVFAGLIAAVFALAVLGFSGYGVYSLISNENGGLTNQISSAGGNLGANSNSVQINVAQRGDEVSSSTVSSDGVLTTTQVAAKMKPSVVGVVQYQRTSSLLMATEPTGEGSGIIISSDGYIITNAHVIDGADYVEVVLDNGDTYEAEVVGSDIKTDIAVLKIDASNLVAAEIGDSDDLQEGEMVMAIGNPGGLQGSVTYGYVSALNRPVSTENGGYTMDCIQTDAAINPGNSGGALVDMYGRVVGINSSKIADVDYEGIGFAIPMNQVVPIAEQLMEYGRVTGRAKLGIYGGFMSQAVANMYGSGIPAGFVIQSVESDSNLAGKLQEGDIITRFNDTDITSTTVLMDLLKNCKPGDSVKLTVSRVDTKGQVTSFTVNAVLMEDTGVSSNTEDQSSASSEPETQNTWPFGR